MPVVAFAQSDHSLSLHQAIEDGLKGPANSIFEGQSDQVKALVKQAAMRPNPRLYLQSEDLRPWDPAFTMGNDSESTGYFGQTIEVAGKRGKRILLAEANAMRAEADAEQQRLALAARIAKAYWAYAVALSIVDLQKQSLQSADEIVRYHQERVAAGAMRGIDLLRMQLEQDRVKIDLQTAETGAEVARLQLLNEMGHRDITEKPQLSDPLNAVNTIEEIPLEMAIERRPDVRSAVFALQASEADGRLQRANKILDPDLIGGYKRNMDSNTLYAGLQITLPFFNRNQGEVDRADAATRTSRAQLLQTRNAARTNIEASRIAYSRSRTIVTDTMPQMQARAKQNLATLDDAYRSGGFDLLRYIDARRLVIEVETATYLRLAEFHNNEIQLLLAYGEKP